jgi:SPP1 gp7 family putative phage head morphogenesis protein
MLHQIIKQAIRNNKRLLSKYKSQPLFIDNLKPSAKVDLLNTRLLTELVSRINNRIKQDLIPKLKLYESYYANKLVDSSVLLDLDYVVDIKSVINTITLDYSDTTFNQIVESVVLQMAGNTQKDIAAALTKEINRLVGIDISPFIQSHTDDIKQTLEYCKDYIESIPKKYLADVQSKVLLNIQKGMRSSSIVKELANQYGITLNRAKVIARDQTSKFNLALTTAQAKDIGSDEFKFSTSHDERVRRTHRDADGKLCKVGDSVYNLRYDVMCRCVLIIQVKFDWETP